VSCFDEAELKKVAMRASVMVAPAECDGSCARNESLVVQTRRLKTKVRLALVLVATVLLLALFFRNSDPRKIWALLRSTNLGWFAVGLSANIVALLCRTERWRWILDPDDPPPFYATFFSTSLGFMTSAILPIRAADVIRPALLSRRTSIRFSRALGTVVNERLMDLIAILSLFVVFVMTSGRRFADDPRTASKFAPIQFAGLVAGIVVVSIIILQFALYWRSGLVRRFHEFLGRLLPLRFRDSWMHFFDSFVASLAVMGHRRAFPRIILFTAGIWLALSSQFFFVTLATHHPLPFPVSFFLTGITILGLMIPTPGGVGGFHKACQIALVGFYGFGVNESIAVAVVFHLVGTLPIIVVGTSLLLREHVGLGQILGVRKEIAE
jgi:uncharacterized protein (TIRG00374 family)